MKTQLVVILLFILSLSACVSKKYGRYFNNDLNLVSTNADKRVADQNYILTSSIDNSPVVSAHKEVISSQSLTVEKEPARAAKTIREQTPAAIATLDRKTERQKNKLGRKESTKRKTEPLGVASFGLLMLTILLFLAEGAVSLSTGFGAFLILAAMVGGGISYEKIKNDKQRWKGRFFGGLTAVLGLILLLSLGLAALFSGALGTS